MANYDDFAFYYDLTHDQLTEDVPFLLKLIDKLATKSEKGQIGKGKRKEKEEGRLAILELGCGSGRLLRPLAEQTGHTYIGVDSSAEMLERARRKMIKVTPPARDRVVITQGDMTHFKIDQQFDLILIMCNTLMHLDDHETANCLATVRRHLKPAGQLLIDVINPVRLAAAEDQPELALEESFDDERDGGYIYQYASHTNDISAQIFSLTWEYRKEHTAVATFASRHHYRYLHQLQMMLQAAGLQFSQSWGDYDAQPYDEFSDRLMVCAGRSG